MGGPEKGAALDLLSFKSLGNCVGGVYIFENIGQETSVTGPFICMWPLHGLRRPFPPALVRGSFTQTLRALRACITDIAPVL